MIYKVRKSVFETNSSSTHSIVLQKDKDFVFDTSLVPDRYGNVEIDLYGFGWEWFKHNNAAKKASYIATYAQEIIDTYNNDLKNNITSYYTESNFEMSKTIINNLINVVKEYTKADEVNFVNNTGWDCYVDHQSLEGSDHELLLREIGTNKQKLHDFIFNKNNWLLGGNDNDYAPLDFYVLEEHIEYKYKLKFLHNTDEEFNIYFYRRPTIQELQQQLQRLRIVYILEKDLITKNPKKYDIWDHYELDYENSIVQEIFVIHDPLQYSIFVKHNNCLSSNKEYMKIKYNNNRRYYLYTKIYFELEEIK